MSFVFCRSFVLMVLVLTSVLQQVALCQQKPGAYTSDKSIISKGQALFAQKCASCHSFKQQGIGPDLSGITTQVSAGWLQRFIVNPAQMLKADDKRTAALFARYKVLMPSNTDLDAEELKALLSYINTYKTRPVSNEQTSALPVKNPVPAKIESGHLTLQLETVVTAPKTAELSPLSRINLMVTLPGSPERVFVQELRGQLYELRNDTLLTVFDIKKLRPEFTDAPGLATGFGSFAFHPDFSFNGLFYTTHTEKPGLFPADFTYHDSIGIALQWVLTEWKSGDRVADSFEGKGRELFRINMPGQIHGVQHITFNPLAIKGSADYGLLYIGIGDGGSAEAGYSAICHSNKNILGSVIRIDPLGSNSRNKKYGIPAGNPYTNAKDSAIQKEIFARGFRNPNRITWSPDGKMLITDIGLNNIEELNIGFAGGDYGWPTREGTFVLNNKAKMNVVYRLPPKPDRFVYPVVQYDHDEGKAISGGFVYTGAIEQLKDKYIFGDIVYGRVFYVENSRLQAGHQAEIKEFNLQFNNIPGTFESITGQSKSDLRFGIGANQQLYLFTKSDGKIWKVKNCVFR